MPHDHTHLKGDRLLAAAEAALTDAGERWTPMRAKVFEALTSIGRPASAYDIAEAVSQTENRRVPANSIYRILDVFVETNLAQRVESANAYVANAHPACRHDCMFLICDGCGTITHLDDDRLTRSFRNAAKSAGFDARRPVIEMRGRCAACA